MAFLLVNIAYYHLFLLSFFSATSLLVKEPIYQNLRRNKGISQALHCRQIWPQANK